MTCRRRFAAALVVDCERIAAKGSRKPSAPDEAAGFRAATHEAIISRPSRGEVWSF
jgi:hypothetical protein